MISFRIPGDPVGKGRGRIGQGGGKVWNVTPAKTRLYEAMVRELAEAAFIQLDPTWREHKGPWIPWTEAVWLRIEIYLAPPASWSQKRQDEAIHNGWAPAKPDADNVIKAILDGMNGVVFDDDKRVCDLTCWKSYARTASVFVEAGLI